MGKERVKEQLGKVEKQEHDDFLLPPKPSPEYHAAYHETSSKHEDSIAAEISKNLHELEMLQHELKSNKNTADESKSKEPATKGILKTLFQRKRAENNTSPSDFENIKNPTRDFLSAIKTKTTTTLATPFVDTLKSRFSASLPVFPEMTDVSNNIHKDNNPNKGSTFRIINNPPDRNDKELRELQRQIKRDKSDLDREQSSIVKKIKQLEKDQKDLDARERDFLATLERVEAEKRNLDTKQRQELKELQQQKSQFQKSLEKINVYEQQLLQKEETLFLKEEELKLREQDLKTTKIAIDTEEENIVAKFNEIKETKNMLDKEQEALLREITRLENDQKLLDEKEKEVLDLIAQLDEQKRAQEQKKFELDTREAELLTREDTFSEKMIQLQKELERIKVLKDKVQDLEKLEATYERLKKRLSQGYGQLEMKFRKEHGLDDLHPCITSDKITPRDNSAAGDQTSTLSTTPMTSEQILFPLVQTTKEAIQKKDFIKARQIIQQLFERSYQLDEQAKRNAYYMIRSLENDLKMKELGV